MPVEITKRLINSIPSAGNFKVKNIYVDAATGKLVVKYDNTSVD